MNAFCKHISVDGPPLKQFSLLNDQQLGKYSFREERGGWKREKDQITLSVYGLSEESLADLKTRMKNAEKRVACIACVQLQWRSRSR